MTFTVDHVGNLPAGFEETFTSHTLDVDGVSIHAVVGGQGPALLLLPAWPQFWYGWRLMMPALAEHYTVVAADLRGVGASAKPRDGYDGATLAEDMAGLMTALGHDTFAVAGYDLGMIVAYALAAAHPHRVTKLVLAEAILPGLSPSPPLFMDKPTNEFLWHFAFNRLGDINEQMVRGREEVYFGHQFASKAASPDAIAPHAVELYVNALRDPAALRASFEFYRSDATTEQIIAWQQRGRLSMPVLAVGGQYASGASVAEVASIVAADVTELVIPGSGHFLPEEAPEAFTAALLGFLAA